VSAASRPVIRATRVEIDLDALAHNARALAALAGVPLTAVVKADAYGHGAVTVARYLEDTGAATRFAVSLVEEGVELRQAGVTSPILVMGPSQRGGEAEVVARGLTPVVADAGEFAVLAEIGRARGYPVDVHLKVDTGMSRLGVSATLAPVLAARGDGVRIVGLMTHFACADGDDPADPRSMTRRQLAAFAEVDRAVVAAGAPVTVRHAANSAGALLFPEARLDTVRCGLALYGGGWWDGAVPAFGRRQAMRLVTEIAEIRDAAAGTSVGYGATWTAARATRLAVLPVGYADGLPRRASGLAQVLVRGQRVPLVGTVSMDIVIADVTDVPGAAPGDEVVLLGDSADAGGPAITTGELAAWAGVTEYEVTCGMSKRVPRVARAG
jgi:alanine racemase